MPEINAIATSRAIVDTDSLAGQASDNTGLRVTGSQIKDAADLARATTLTRNGLVAQKTLTCIPATNGVDELLGVHPVVEGQFTLAHGLDLWSGVPARVFGFSDHSHFKFRSKAAAGPAANSAGEVVQFIHSASASGSNITLAGVGAPITGTDIATEDSIDTTATVVTGTANSGIIKLRYSISIAVSLNDKIVLKVLNPVAGLQPGNYGGIVTQAPALVSSKYEVLVTVTGLDALAYAAANVANTAAQNADWALCKITGVASVIGTSVTAFARDTAGPADQATVTFSGAHGLSQGSAVAVWADSTLTGLTGLYLATFNSATVVEVTSTTAVKVRFKNLREPSGFGGLTGTLTLSGTVTTPSTMVSVYAGTKDPQHESGLGLGMFTFNRNAGGITRNFSIGRGVDTPASGLSRAAAIGFDLPQVTVDDTVRIGAGATNYLDIVGGEVLDQNGQLLTSRSSRLMSAAFGGLNFDGCTASTRVTTAPLATAFSGTGDFSFWCRFKMPTNAALVLPGSMIPMALSDSASSQSSANSCYLIIDSGAGGTLRLIKRSAASGYQDTGALPTGLATAYAGKVVDVVVVRSGAALWSVYINGVLATTSASYASETVSFTYAHLGLGNTANCFSERIHRAVVFNRALSAADVAELVAQGVNAADQWGALPQIINTTTLNGGFETAGGGGLDTLANWFEYIAAGGTITRDTVDFSPNLSSTASVKFTGDTSGTSLSVYQSSIGTVAGKRYRVSLAAKRSSAGNMTVKGVITATTLLTFAATTSWSDYTGEFVAVSAEGLKLEHATNSINLWVDNFTHERIGAILDLDLGEGCGYQVRDRSTNNLHGMFSNAGVTWSNPSVFGQIRWTVTASGNQQFGAVGTPLGLPTNARITSIVANAASAVTLSLGTSSGGTTIVNAAGLSTGRNDLTVVSRMPNSTNLWANLSGAISTQLTINYEIVD